MVCKCLPPYKQCYTATLGPHIHLLLHQAPLHHRSRCVRSWLGALWRRPELQGIYCGKSNCRSRIGWDIQRIDCHHLTGDASSQATHVCWVDGLDVRHCLDRRSVAGWCIHRSRHMAVVFLHQVGILESLGYCTVLSLY